MWAYIVAITLRNGKDLKVVSKKQKDKSTPKGELVPKIVIEGLEKSKSAKDVQIKMVLRRILVLMMGCLDVLTVTTEPNDNSFESKSSVVDESAITSPRVRLSDGRYLAYRERGVPKNKSKYSIILVHGFGSSKEMSFMA
ncbi:hypothetical protein HAX54_012473 [Datura stramonium]|uniref:Uncharacterized protein n=1 Tax=Datura stramonium TaxID=4076 RepID=A0ABS8TMS3_DATST|nr:hypothetical protein [Datura stramonium]